MALVDDYWMHYALVTPLIYGVVCGVLCGANLFGGSGGLVIC